MKGAQCEHIMMASVRHLGGCWDPDGAGSNGRGAHHWREGSRQAPDIGAEKDVGSDWIGVLFWIGSLTTCETGRRDRLESGRRVRKAAAQRGDSSGLDQTEVDTCD